MQRQYIIYSVLLLNGLEPVVSGMAEYALLALDAAGEIACC